MSFLSSADALPLAQERLGARDDVLRGEAELLEDRRPRRRSAETLERDDVSILPDPFPPAEPDAGLDGEASLDVRREHGVAVLDGLFLEELPARHRDDPRGDALLLQLLRRLEGDPDLRARGHDDQLRGAVAVSVPEDVRTAFHPRRVAELRAIEHRQVLAAQREPDGAVLALEGDLPRVRSLVRIGRAEKPKVRDC